MSKDVSRYRFLALAAILVVLLVLALAPSLQSTGSTLFTSPVLLPLIAHNYPPPSTLFTSPLLLPFISHSPAPAAGMDPGGH